MESNRSIFVKPDPQDSLYHTKKTLSVLYRLQRYHDAIVCDGDTERAEKIDAVIVDATNAINCIIHDLPIDERAVIEMRYISFRRIADIASIMGVSIATVKKNHRAAVRKIDLSPLMAIIEKYKIAI